MSDPKRRQKSNSSRTIAIAAVAVLIVVAIAGIVLASRGTPAAPEAAPAAAAAPVASTPQEASAPTAQINPNEVVFDAGSDKLPATAKISLGRFAEAARNNAAGVRMSVRFLTGANKTRDKALAMARAEAIRQVLVADAIGADKIQIELIEMPDGSLTVPDSNRVDLQLR
jgi:outer membrane protein OmpA-like peptidoglycan-associated protein